MARPKSKRKIKELKGESPQGFSRFTMKGLTLGFLSSIENLRVTRLLLFGVNSSMVLLCSCFVLFFIGLGQRRKSVKASALQFAASWPLVV